MYVSWTALFLIVCSLWTKNKNMGNKPKFRWYVSFLLRQWIAWVNVRSVIINQQVRFRAKQRAKYSSLQLVSNCVKHCIKLTTQISTAINAPFSQNSNRMASSVDRNRKFCERIFFNSFKIQGKVLAFRLTKLLWFVDFAIQFCFRWKISFHKKWPSSQVWQWRDFLGIAILCYA